MDAPGSQAAIAEGTATQPEELERAISGPLLYFYVLGDVLGSGIYALVGLMAAQVGGAFWEGPSWYRPERATRPGLAEAV